MLKLDAVVLAVNDKDIECKFTFCEELYTGTIKKEAFNFEVYRGKNFYIEIDSQGITVTNGPDIYHNECEIIKEIKELIENL